MERKYKFLAGAVASTVLAIAGAAAGGNTRLEIPGSDWSIRAGLSAGDKNKLERPLEDYITQDITDEDDFIDIPFNPHIGPVGILGQISVGEDPEGQPFNLSFNIDK